MPSYTILVSRDGGATWRRWPGEFEGPNGDAAIERLRDAVSDLKRDTETLFYPTTNFEPRKMAPELVRRWKLTKVSDLDDDGNRQTSIDVGGGDDG